MLRLSKGMTYKAALAGLDLGGGKAVILGDPASDKNEALLRAFARFVDSLGGRYITAEDVGHHPGRHGPDPPGDPLGDRRVPVARRVGRSQRGHRPGPLLRHEGGGPDACGATTNLEGRHVAVSGVGKVGYAFVRQLVEDRCRVTVADIVARRRRAGRGRLRGRGRPGREDPRHRMRRLRPLRPGRRRCRSPPSPSCAAPPSAAAPTTSWPSRGCDEALADAGILYAPDYCVNAGGIINIAEELRGYSRERAETGLRHIYDTTLAVFDRAEAEGITTAAAADRLAEARIEAVGRLNLIRPPSR